MSMKLGDLPADMKKSFRPYALGDHDDAEIDLKKLPVCTDKGMPVLAYPESSREKMKAFDANGDGYVEMYELERAAELYSESKNTSKRLMQLVAMLLAIIAVLTGVIAGCTYAIVDGAKETKVSGNGELHVANKPDVVATTGVAEKTEDIFDFVTKNEPVDLAAVKSLTLVTGTTTRQYTITGHEKKIGELSFFTATGHKVVVTPNEYSIVNSNGSTLATVTKATSRRRRSLLAGGGGNTVTTGVSTGGSAAAALKLFIPSKFQSTHTSTSAVFVNGVLQTSGTLVAMAGTEIRGYRSIQAVPPFAAHPYLALMTIYADTAGETLSFKFIEESGTEHDLEISSDGVAWDGKFKTNDSTGNIVKPLVLKSKPPAPFDQYSKKMTLVAFLALGLPVDYRIMEGKFSAYSLEDGTLRGESTEPKTMWFGFYPIWSIEIHGNTDREMIELRFENADGTWILNEREVFRPDTMMGTLNPVNPMWRAVTSPTVILPPPADIAPAVPKPTLPINQAPFKNSATAVLTIKIDGMDMIDGTIVAYDGTTPLGGSDNIRKDPFGRHVALVSIGGHDSTVGKKITFYFWGNPESCTECIAVKLPIMQGSSTFTPNGEYGKASAPLPLMSSSDPNFSTETYDFSMSLYAKVKIDGSYVTTGKLTAYNGNQIVGVIARPSNPEYRTAIGRPLPPIPGIPEGFFLFMIYNDSNYVPGITFKYTKPDGTVIDLNGSITFTANSMSYDLDNMVDLSN